MGVGRPDLVAEEGEVFGWWDYPVCYISTSLLLFSRGRKDVRRNQFPHRQKRIL